MANKKFTLAAVAAAAIAAAPMIAPALGASTVFADDVNHAANAAVIAAQAGATDSSSVAAALSSAAGSATATTTTAATASTDDTATIPVSGTVTVKHNAVIYKDASGQDTPVGGATQGATYNVIEQVTLGDGTTYYEIGSNQYLNADDVDSSKVVSSTDAKTTPTKTTTKKTDATTKNIGVIKVNYDSKYGIQIWNKAGQIVKYNAADAKYWNAKHAKKVKVGDAKKLPGQTTWKVYNATYKDHGTTYYNLGGDQYIDAHYVKKIK